MSESETGHTPGPIEAQDAIRRMCKLQAYIYRTLNMSGAADCFCGKSGFWGDNKYDGSFEGGYRNDGEVLAFIEAAVEEQLQLDSASDQMLAALREARKHIETERKSLQDGELVPAGPMQYANRVQWRVTAVATIDAAIQAATGGQE